MTGSGAMVLQTGDIQHPVIPPAAVTCGNTWGWLPITGDGQARGAIGSTQGAGQFYKRAFRFTQDAISTRMPLPSNALASLSEIPSSVMKELTTSSAPSRVNEDLLILVESATR